MNMIGWRLKSIIKNLQKRKFKALFRYLYDSRYRRDVDYMLNLVRRQPVKQIYGSLPLYQIVPGHSVNYPEWVKTLRKKIRVDGYTKIEPIKVIYDESKKKFLVVDGNHRWHALVSEISLYHVVKVDLLIPATSKREYYESF